jgi:threonine dehydratase
LLVILYFSTLINSFHVNVSLKNQKGVSAYYHCKNYVQDIILVDDHEIISACKRIFDVGLKVEPSGCAGLAALLANKIPNLDITETDKKVKIVILLSGGNVTVEELNNIFNQSS